VRFAATEKGTKSMLTSAHSHYWILLMYTVIQYLLLMLWWPSKR